MNINEKFERLHNKTEFSVFYPKDYTVAVFQGAFNVGPVQQALLAVGWRADDLIQFSGAEFLTWNTQNELGKDALQKVQSAVAELIGQETEFVKVFLELAQQGHQFLTIYTPSPEDDQRLVDAIKSFKPVKLTDYQSAAVVDLELKKTSSGSG